MKSILHNKSDRTCYLCILLDRNYREYDELHEHHVFYGTSNRKNSEKYGMKVYLHPAHHNMSNDSVHFNKEYDLMVKQNAQKVFEETHTREEFIAIFGRNYL